MLEALAALEMNNILGDYVTHRHRILDLLLLPLIFQHRGSVKKRSLCLYLKIFVLERNHAADKSVQAVQFPPQLFLKYCAETEFAFKRENHIAPSVYLQSSKHMYTNDLSLQ